MTWISGISPAELQLCFATTMLFGNVSALLKILRKQSYNARARDDAGCCRQHQIN
jgi:hypothetical protein